MPATAIAVVNEEEYIDLKTAARIVGAHPITSKKAFEKARVTIRALPGARILYRRADVEAIRDQSIRRLETWRSEP